MAHVSQFFNMIVSVLSWVALFVVIFAKRIWDSLPVIVKWLGTEFKFVKNMFSYFGLDVKHCRKTDYYKTILLFV